MTKNEDTSPWMHFPDDPKAIKRHNELVLSSIPTAELVAELSKRDGVAVDSVKPDWEYRLEKDPPELEEDPNIYNSWDDSDNPSIWSGICGEGPCKILVVRE